MKYGSENLLRVAVSNAITGDVLPLSSIHNIYGGISREVELIVTDSTAVSPLYLGSSGVLIHPRAVSTEREKAGHTAECTSFGPEKAGRERTNEQTGTGKDTKGRGK